MMRFNSIESLRGVAAALVLFAHVKFPVIDACGETAVPGLLWPKWGACGVDLFFVISGFVISLTLDRPGATWRLFLAARVARVVPVYFVFTTACLVMPAVVCVPVTRDVIADSFLFLPVWETGRFAGTIHPYGWTLSFEIWFYLTSTVAAAVVGPRIVPAWLVAVFSVGPLLLFVGGYDRPWYFPNFALSPLVMEFALGCVAYRLARRPPRWGAGVAALTAGLVGLVLGSFRGDRLADYANVLAGPGLAFERVVFWGLPSFLVVAGAAAVERRADWWPARRAAAGLGGISYSLYLVQPIMLFAVGSLCQRIGGVPPWVVAGSAATVVVLTAAMCHRVVEKPLVAATRRRLEQWLAVSRAGDPMPATGLGGRCVPESC